MSRYFFKEIEDPKGEQVAPFAVFGVITQGHERLMNTASHRYEAVARPAAESLGLGDYIVQGGMIDTDMVAPLRALDENDKPIDREGFVKVARWLKLVANAQIDLRCDEVAILTHKLKGDLILLNDDLEGVEWPRFDWKAPEETVRDRAAILMAYLPKDDLMALSDAAKAHHRGEKLPVGTLGNSPSPSKQASNGAQTAAPQTIAPPVLATSV